MLLLHGLTADVLKAEVDGNSTGLFRLSLSHSYPPALAAIIQQHGAGRDPATAAAPAVAAVSPHAAEQQGYELLRAAQKHQLPRLSSVISTWLQEQQSKQQRRWQHQQSKQQQQRTQLEHPSIVFKALTPQHLQQWLQMLSERRAGISRRPTTSKSPTRR